MALPKKITKNGGLTVHEGGVGLYAVTESGKVSDQPYCVQPACMDRTMLHTQSGFWLAADHNNVVVDGIMPHRPKKPGVCTPYVGSWAWEMEQHKKGR